MIVACPGDMIADRATAAVRPAAGSLLGRPGVATPTASPSGGEPGVRPRRRWEAP